MHSYNKIVKYRTLNYPMKEPYIFLEVQIEEDMK